MKTLKGFKDFLLQGNVLELAIAVIIGTAFGAVVTAFTQLLLDFVGLLGGQPDFSQVTLPYINVNIGGFLNALLSFVIIAAVVYFFVIQPYEKLKAIGKKKDEETPAAPTSEELLTEIRDLLKAQQEDVRSV